MRTYGMRVGVYAITDKSRTCGLQGRGWIQGVGMLHGYVQWWKGISKREYGMVVATGWGGGELSCKWL